MRIIPTIQRGEPQNRDFAPLSRLFEDFMTEWPFRASALARRESWRPAVNIVEKDGNLLLEAEIPGVSEKDIDLKLEGNVLTLKGERKLENEEDRNNYHRIESFYGSFTRSFTLPETVDYEEIKAEYKNGVLTVTIPQKPEVKPRAIPVSSK